MLLPHPLNQFLNPKRIYKPSPTRSRKRLASLGLYLLLYVYHARLIDSQRFATSLVNPIVILRISDLVCSIR